MTPALHRIASTCLMASCLFGAAAAADDAPEPTPQAVALSTRIDGLRQANTSSTDLRLRILYSVGPGVEREPRPDHGLYATERITAAALYDQARGSTDPLVLALLIHRCGLATKTMVHCDRLALARRWIEADTQNQVAWLALASVQRELGDAEGARTTFVRAASASAWHEVHGDIARLVARQLPRDLTPLERKFALLDALAVAGAGNLIGTLQTVTIFCKDGAVRDACRRIVRTMVRDAESSLTIHLVVRAAVEAGLDQADIASYQQRDDAMRWALTIQAGLMPALAAVDDPDPVPSVVRLQTLIDLGERRFAEQTVRERHLDERGAAGLLVATLDSAERAHRLAILRGE